MNYRLYEKYSLMGFFGGVVLLISKLVATHMINYDLESMVQEQWINTPYWRFIISTLLGCAAIAFFLLGFYSLHMMIEDTIESKIVEIIATAAIFGIASVGVLNFISQCVLPIAFKAAIESGVAIDSATAMIEKMAENLEIVEIILTLFCDIEGVIAIYLVVSGKARLPLWAALLNPFVLNILIEIAVKFTHHPYSGTVFASLEGLGEGLTYMVTYMYFRKRRKEQENSSIEEA